MTLSLSEDLNSVARISRRNHGARLTVEHILHGVTVTAKIIQLVPECSRRISRRLGTTCGGQMDVAITAKSSVQCKRSGHCVLCKHSKWSFRSRWGTSGETIGFGSIRGADARLREIAWVLSLAFVAYCRALQFKFGCETCYRGFINLLLCWAG
jgi:hypothetical protein